MTRFISVIIGHHSVGGRAGGIFDGFCFSGIAQRSVNQSCNLDQFAAAAAARLLSHDTTSRTFIIDTQIDRTGRIREKKRERQALQVTPKPWQIHREIADNAQLKRGRVGQLSRSGDSSWID